MGQNQVNVLLQAEPLLARVCVFFFILLWFTAYFHHCLCLFIGVQLLEIDPSYPQAAEAAAGVYEQLGMAFVMQAQHDRTGRQAMLFQQVRFHCVIVIITTSANVLLVNAVNFY